MGEQKADQVLGVNEIKKSLEGKIKKSVIVPELLTQESKLKFRCYPGIGCFTRCCSGIRIYLTPYDIFRLKNRLGLNYRDFLLKYTEPFNIENTVLPLVIIKMKDDEIRSCPFVTPEGCIVYTDRPLTCRYYPLGMGIMKKYDRKTGMSFFIKIKEDHCLGHLEEKVWTVDEWREDQESDLYDEMNYDWMEVVLKAKTLGNVQFSQRSLDLFFIVSTNLDLFRDFVFNSNFLKAYKLDNEYIEKIKTDELEFLKFALKWLRFVTFNEGDFKVDQEAREQAKARLLAKREEEIKRMMKKEEAGS